MPLKALKDKYLPVLLIICIFLLGYSLLISFITFDLALKVRSKEPAWNDAEQQAIMVVLLFESQSKASSLNVTIVTTATANQSLEIVLKNTVGSHLKGRYYPGMGFYVTSIFNLTEKINGTGWIYQEYDIMTNQWITPSVGVSYYFITNPAALKFVFLP